MERDKSTISSSLKVAYQLIESAADLKRNKLALFEYHLLPGLLWDVLSNEETGQTIYAGVANWCLNHGLKVWKDGIGWKISL